MVLPSLSKFQFINIHQLNLDLRTEDSEPDPVTDDRESRKTLGHPRNSNGLDRILVGRTFISNPTITIFTITTFIIIDCD